MDHSATVTSSSDSSYFESLDNVLSEARDLNEMHQNQERCLAVLERTQRELLLMKVRLRVVKLEEELRYLQTKEEKEEESKSDVDEDVKSEEEHEEIHLPLNIHDSIEAVEHDSSWGLPKKTDFEESLDSTGSELLCDFEDLPARWSQQDDNNDDDIFRYVDKIPRREYKEEIPRRDSITDDGVRPIVSSLSRLKRSNSFLRLISSRSLM